MTATGDDGHAAGGACLNCGATLAGGYCHRCGQSADVHRSLGAVWHDLAHGAFHFEGRIWRTLPMLLLRPGELTRRYVAGERARFVSPLALFLFIVFVLFTMLSVVGAHLEWTNSDAVAPGVRAAEVARNGDRIAALAERRSAATRPGDVARIDAEIARRRQRTQAILAEAKGSGAEWTWLEGRRTGWSRLDKGLEKAAEDPNLILYKLQSNAYKFAWALIPLSLPFLWLLFPFSRRFNAYDHVVFISYSLSFVSLLIVAASLLGMAGMDGGKLTVAIGAATAIHMYRQLRGAYALGRAGALVRTALLLVGAGLAITGFALLLAGLGLVG